MSPHPSPEAILKTVFGYHEYRPLQREVIENVLLKRDTLAIMPTGGGKSLCYQIPALIFPGLTVVVSPLIALMKDQVEALHELGVPALFLNSSLSIEEYQENMDRVRSGKIKLLYVAPETLLTPRLFNLLLDLPVDCLTIDEAHCISEWGHDFRPEYRQLADVRDRFPRAVWLALTATATPRVRQDIRETLRFSVEGEFIASFNRANLFIEVLPKTDPAAQTLEFLRKYPNQAGIIYCFSRKGVDDLTTFLVAKGYAARPYHAGLEDRARKDNQELFIRDDVAIMVATIAFGMGINKPNVRFIVHYDLPKSMEGYYQEIGRAGRDGLPAHCLLLYSYGDTKKLSYFIDQKDEPERTAAYAHLRSLMRYAESAGCRRAPLLAYFGEKFAIDNCGMCDNCQKNEGRLTDITIPAQKFLSCVKRTGERFAATHITHVLMGVENEKVLKWGHQGLSTFGIGKDLNHKQWLYIASQLVQKGLLDQGEDIYRTLKLTPRAYEALKSRQPIQGVLLAEEQVPPPAKKAGQVEHDAALFELLRKKRKELADEGQVPPYVIFSDRSLVEMAAYYPMSSASLIKINGVGQVKLARYGEIFLGVIRAYCLERNLAEKPRRTGGEIPAGQLALKPRYVEVGETYNSGESVRSLMARYGVQQGTILEHLSKYALEGNPLREDGSFLDFIDLPAAQRQAALLAFAELGPNTLKPVFDRLNGSVDYDVLKILRLHYLSQRNGYTQKR